MKGLILFLLTLFLAACNHTSSPKQYKQYIGKTVNEFLETHRAYSELSIKGGKPGSAFALVAKYPSDSLSIELIPSEFRYMKKFDEDEIWNIDLFKKEKISIIRIYKSDTSVIEVSAAGTEMYKRKEIKY